MEVLEGLYYSKDHEWVKVEGDKAYIGITDYAQHSLGNIVYIELPEVGAELNAGDVLGVVESVKAASDVYTPVDGKVLEVNNAIVDDPSLVNNDPYGSWMILVELKDRSQLENLMTAEEYKKFLDEE
ncbi:glycine cleavage system H protein [Thermoanaerobacter mathranii subsp. mathranii str. A3]|jgi:glycine cleavage system H protein|uniref:Glycine cleavage system H protein n=3 Tax=Thermoanaerobacter TaxID=1754 RepID=D3T645_THEIA|nr:MULTISPECIES: glycine cleavage system protein GcvH [Thermoanaerobacter]MDK2814156.1 glycine cleavage system protein [Thermoanaerobacter sp.]SFE13392.1 glycine cleavage system H protein [Thermoanaerobacter thermohydrosulfuricus]ADD01576.1 glycine cleavage system H protein [Thermoanaerobacter italicus Ab9]ADH60112.1 glycine cleavage system H protein [Thermoanaerobacter mathranii subsp. mathranii str. A3]MBT1280169.1 glycine cleavage system protein GcvH [Thermoanaerobacter sp. CM-CNRG TB177]